MNRWYICSFQRFPERCSDISSIYYNYRLPADKERADTEKTVRLRAGILKSCLSSVRTSRERNSLRFTCNVYINRLLRNGGILPCFDFGRRKKRLFSEKYQACQIPITVLSATGSAVISKKSGQKRDRSRDFTDRKKTAVLPEFRQAPRQIAFVNLTV